MAEDPTVFSPVGRAQLVSDFCYFYAQNPTNSSLKQQVFDTVRGKKEKGKETIVGVFESEALRSL